VVPEERLVVEADGERGNPPPNALEA
jgi:hypothetical protein